MDDRINLPPRLSGRPEDQTAQIWQYLYKLAETLNFRLEGVGRNELTDREMEIMRPILGPRMPGEMITMKNMIVRMAEYIQKNGGN